MEQILDFAVIAPEDGLPTLVEAVRAGPLYYINFYQGEQEDSSRLTASRAELSLWWILLTGTPIAQEVKR